MLEMASGALAFVPRREHGGENGVLITACGWEVTEVQHIELVYLSADVLFGFPPQCTFFVCSDKCLNFIESYLSQIYCFNISKISYEISHLGSLEILD